MAGPAEDRHWFCVAPAITGIPGTLGTRPKGGGKQKFCKDQEGGTGKVLGEQEVEGPCRLVVWVREERRGSSPRMSGFPKVKEDMRTPASRAV